MQLDNNDVKQLLAILQQLVEKVTVAGTADPETVEESVAKPSKKKRGRKPKVEEPTDTEQDDDSENEEDYKFNSKIKTKNINVKKKTYNKFDSMPEYRMHKEDVEIDKKLNIAPPSQRSRTYKPVDARCRVCGRVESVNPALVDSSERYKCNRCAASAG